MNTGELSLSPAEQHPYASSQRLRSASTQHRLQFGDDRVYTGSIDDYGPSGGWAPQPSSGGGGVSGGPGSGGGSNPHHYQAQRSVSSSSSGGNLHAGFGQHEELFLDLSASITSSYPSTSSGYPSSSSSYNHDGFDLSEMDVDAAMASTSAYRFDPSLSDHEQHSDHASHSHAHEYERQQQQQHSYQRHENPPRHQQFQQQYQPHHSFTPSTGVHSAPELASSEHYYGQHAPPSTSVSTNEASEDDAPLASPYLGSPPSSPTKGSRARTRFQNRVSKAQPYPTSSSASPARSRSGSIKSSVLPSLSISTSHQSGSASSSPSFFPGGLPSPYRQSSTPNSATMDPSQSIRSSSPSSASSVSGNAMSRASSFSAASSIPPNEAALSEALAASTASMASMASAVSSANLYRSTASSTTVTRATVSRSQSRRGSPTKSSTGRVRKLCDIDRREVCLYSAANPGMKQDLIASKFDIDRTTVSKILRDKTKWLAIVGPRPDAAVAESPDSAATPSAGDNHSSPPSVATPHQSPTFPHTPHQGAVTSTMPMSMTSSISSLFSELSTTGTPSISQNRNSSDSTGISKIDSEVLTWVQSSMRTGSEPSDEALKTKAKEVAKRHRGLEMFKATGAWLDNFKTRTGLGRLLAARIVEESNLSDVSEDNLESHDDDDEHAEGAERSQWSKAKKYKRQSILRRNHNDGAAASSSPLKSSEMFGSSGGATSLPGTLKASKMEVDSRTPLRLAFAGSMAGDTSLDSEATPTHSTVHSRATSGTASASTDQEFNEAFAQYGTEGTAGSLDQRRASSYGKDPSMSTPSRSDSFGSNKSLSTNGYSPSDPSQSPFAFGGFPPDGSNANAFGNPFLHSNSDGSGFNGSEYPLKSPFQTSSPQSSSQSLCSVSFNAASGLSGSTDNSPQATHNPHGRSFSIASSTSSFSGLTAFSSQTSQGTPLSTSMSHSQSISVPSTPAMGTSGYYSHGPTGNLSQLQAAFGTGQAPQAPVQISPQTVAPYLLQGGASEQSPQRIGLVRRQTISGFPSPSSFQGVDLAPPSRVQSQAASQQTSRHPLTASISDFAVATSAPGSGSSTPVTALQAFEGLMMAHRWLNSQDASGFTQPGDLIASSDLRSRLAERLGLDLPSEAPGPLPRSASMSASMSLPGSRGATPSLASSTTSNTSAIHTGGKVHFPNSPSRPTRMRSGRTQSTSSIPHFGMNSRSHSTLSLLDASMAEESQQNSHFSLHQ